MINIKDNRCKCNSAIARYGFENDNQMICCAKCCEDGMIDLKNKNRKNCYCKCGKWATFGIDGQQPISCFTCKTTDMIDLKHMKCACGKRAKWGTSLEKITHCAICKIDNMINYDKEKYKCKANEINILCETSGNPKYNGYCTHCFIHLFPNDPLAKEVHQKSKEIVVKNYINENFQGFIHDKPIWTGNCECTHRRRIDHRKLIGNTLLCIETDENQHKYYKENDEKIRYDDVMMIHGGKFIFIRFNPDKYKENNKEKNPLMKTRLAALSKEIEKQIDRIANEKNIELVEVITMYYDK